MTVEISRGIEGLWLIVESDCVIYHIKVLHDESLGWWFAECEDGTLLCTESLKDFWKNRRAIASEVLKDFM